MRNIRTIFNQGISKKIINAELYPFGKGKYVPQSSKKAKKALPIEDIEKINHYKSDNPEVVRPYRPVALCIFCEWYQLKRYSVLKV